MGPGSWSTSTQSQIYLESLSATYPFFCAQSYLVPNQNTSLDSFARTVLRELPDSVSIISREFTIGKHATIFIIDLKNHTVEYFNSFGDDSVAAPFLIRLSQHLTQKYQTNFRYIHQTKDVCLQNDTYQCGFWICKFVQERIRMPYPENFNPRAYLNFDMAAYREKVLASAFEYALKNNL